MNTSDIYVRYEACEIEEHMPLRLFARVPRAKIREFQQASDDPTFSDKDIVKILATPTGRESSLSATRLLDWHFLLGDTPIELQEREPDFKETDGMELWAIKQKAV
jgi:hypothetical protein